FTIVEFGDFRFDLVAHRHHDRALGVGDAAYDIQIGVVVEAVLGDVGDVHDRLAGQQMEALDQLLLVIGQVLHQRAGWFALAEMRDEFLQQRLLGYSFLVAALGVTRYALQLLLATVEVREDQFQIDNLDIALGVDAIGDVDDIVVIEATHHVGDGVGFADVGQELVAQAFTLGGAFNQAGNIDKLHG